MIDPINIAFYDADESKLQEFLLFCLFVANKNAGRTAIVLENFLGSSSIKPFDKLTGMQYNYHLCTIRQRLEKCKTGQYTRLEKALNYIFYHYEAGNYHLNDLKNITFEELLSIPGVGRKTANYFLMYTRKGYQGVVLDSHILKWFKALGYDAPKETPQSEKKYKELERVFITVCGKAKIPLQEADMEIWKYYAGRDYNSSKIPQFSKIRGSNGKFNRSGRI